MTHSYKHETIKAVFAAIIMTLAKGMKMRYIGAGSTTFKQAEALKGVEPDDCYYFANVAKVRGKQDLDLGVDPPPDLVIEIDITNPSLNKLPIYASMRVKELWRYDGSEVTFYRLADDTFVSMERSEVFPKLTCDQLGAFVEIGRQSDSIELESALLEWLSKNLK